MGLLLLFGEPLATQLELQLTVSRETREAMTAELLTSLKKISELKTEIRQAIHMLREASAERDDMSQGMRPNEKHGHHKDNSGKQWHGMACMTISIHACG